MSNCSPIRAFKNDVDESKIADVNPSPRNPALITSILVVGLPVVSPPGGGFVTTTGGLTVTTVLGIIVDVPSE